jgi:hypothetical protein
MVVDQEFQELKIRLEALLADLDRLQLPIVAVHVDLALRRLEEQMEPGIIHKSVSVDEK